jgi:hypothetical protein
VDTLSKEMIHMPGDMKEDNMKFHHIPQKVHNLKLFNLQNFSFNIFGPQLSWITKTVERETVGKGHHSMWQ